jgi:DNA-binding MarR family transcriptional regulator
VAEPVYFREANVSVLITEMEQIMTRKDQQSVEERRETIYEMHLKGSTEKEIAEAVGVNQSTVSRSLEIASKRNGVWFRRHWDHGSLQGSLLKEQRDRLTGVIREAWALYRTIDEADVGKKIQALGLVRSAIKDMGEMLGLELPTLSDMGGLDPAYRVRKSEEETIEVDLSQENVLSSPLPPTSLTRPS